MNKNAKLWVEALRSGEYKQAYHTLRTTSGYCCLGVACEVYRQETGFGKWNLDDDPYHDEKQSFRFIVQDGDGGARLNLPESVMKWLGLADDGGFYINYYANDSIGDSIGHSLAGQNDAGKSFDEIADLIESGPKNLFA